MKRRTESEAVIAAVQQPISEEEKFKREVLAALSNCWGADYPITADSIRAWLEKEWHKMIKAENEVRTLNQKLALARTIVLNMAASMYGQTKNED